MSARSRAGESGNAKASRGAKNSKATDDAHGTGAPRVALVTGGNRGIGLETCRELGERGLRVVLASRDGVKGRDAARALTSAGFDVRSMPLDVTDAESIRALAATVERELGGIDVLVNNAAVLLDDGMSVFDVPVDVGRRTMDTNLFGPLALCQAIVPGMIRRGYGRVVNVSSGAGQLSSMGDYAPTYSMSKAALNALTRIVADTVLGAGAKDVLVNSVDPGWVRTDMGGAGAPRSLEQGAATIVWLATLPTGGPTGGFFRDRKPISW